MAEIVVIRHGEPELRGVFLGSLDPGLSALGRQQAKQISGLSGLPVFVSPLRRARQTAEEAGLDFQVLENLREIDYGPWEGLPWAEIERQYPEESSRKMKDWFGYTVPGAEPWLEFENRVTDALALCTQPCVIVAHLAVNSVIRKIRQGEPVVGFEQAYCEMLRM